MSRNWRRWVARPVLSSLALSVLLLALMLSPEGDNHALAATVPARPTGLVATLVTGPAVALRWQDNSWDERNFEVERSTDHGTFARIDTVGAVSGTGSKVSYKDSATELGHIYAYRVRAVNVAGPSSYSNTELVSTVPPANPTSLRFLEGKPLPEASITLRWDDVSSDETGFEVQRSVDFLPFVRIGTTTGTTFKDTDLVAGPRYAYKVRALKGVLPSDFTNTKSLTTKLIPAAPSNLRITASNPLPDTRVGLGWKNNSAVVTSFQLERRIGAGEFALDATTGPGETTYQYTSGFSQEQINTFRVRAVNGDIPSVPSDTVKWFCPLAPSDLTATVFRGQDHLEVSLAWFDESNIETGYELRVYATDAPSQTRIYSLPRVDGTGATTAQVQLVYTNDVHGGFSIDLRAVGPEPSSWEGYGGAGPIP